MRLVLLGPPGAGKGTQAVLLSKHFKLPHISTGDILREQLKSKGSLAQHLKKIMEEGKLVPDEIVTEIIKLHLGRKDAKNGFILDGYPRNRIQAETLDEILAQKKNPIDLTLYFDASERIIIRRLSGRRVCLNCAANFHIKNMPPKKDMICDFCQTKLYQRKDDTIPTIRKRIEVYLKESKPLFDYYTNQGKLKKISADKDAKIVFRQLKKLFNHIPCARVDND